MKKISLAVVMCLLWGAPMASAQQVQVIQVIEVEGKVQYRKDATSAWDNAAKGLFLAKEAEIKTGATGKCVLSFDPQRANVVTVEKKTQVKIAEIKPGSVFLDKGRVFTLINNIQQVEKFEVKTPTAVTGARGTGWVTEFIDGTTLVSVFDAIVSVAGLDESGNITEEIALQQDFKTEIPTGGDLKDFEPIPDFERQQWVSEIRSLQEIGIYMPPTGPMGAVPPGGVPPGAPGYIPPGAPGYIPPGAPGYIAPGTAGYIPPGAPGYVPPGGTAYTAPGYIPPGAPGYVPPGGNAGNFSSGNAGYVPPGGAIYTAPGGAGYYAPGTGAYTAPGGYVPPGMNPDGTPVTGGGYYAPGTGTYTAPGGYVPPGGDGYYAPGTGAYTAPGGYVPPGMNPDGTPVTGGGYYAPGTGTYTAPGGYVPPGGDGYYAPGAGAYTAPGYVPPAGDTYYAPGYVPPGGDAYVPPGGAGTSSEFQTYMGDYSGTGGYVPPGDYTYYGPDPYFGAYDQAWSGDTGYYVHDPYYDYYNEYYNTLPPPPPCNYNYTCDVGEDSYNCSTDCGGGGSTCNYDSTCNGAETHGTCPSDCP